MPTPPVKLQFSTLASPKNDTANPIEIRKDTWLFFWSISGVNFLGLDTVENWHCKGYHVDFPFWPASKPWPHEKSLAPLQTIDHVSKVNFCGRTRWKIDSRKFGPHTCEMPSDFWKHGLLGLQQWCQARCADQKQITATLAKICLNQDSHMVIQQSFQSVRLSSNSMIRHSNLSCWPKTGCIICKQNSKLTA